MKRFPGLKELLAEHRYKFPLATKPLQYNKPAELELHDKDDRVVKVYDVSKASTAQILAVLREHGLERTQEEAEQAKAKERAEAIARAEEAHRLNSLRHQARIRQRRSVMEQQQQNRSPGSA